ncbi:MAG: MaoC family dehydratase [Dehalococcoidales bacterium]
MDNKENGHSLASLKELPVGYQFPSISYELTEPLIIKYLDAVGEQRDFLKERVVPPLAIAACAMTALSESFSVPPGSIHASQELEFCRSVPLGERVSCSGKIAKRLERGRLNLISIEINAANQSGEIVLNGKATIAVPD